MTQEILPKLGGSRRTLPLILSHLRDSMKLLLLLFGSTELPRFFIVPSRYVATYVREQHAYWLRTRQKPVDTAMRMFRIPASDPRGFEKNWVVLAGAAVQEKHLVLAGPWREPGRLT